MSQGKVQMVQLVEQVARVDGREAVVEIILPQAKVRGEEGLVEGVRVGLSERKETLELMRTNFSAKCMVIHF